jgi:glycosyltransferase involved in cell wall biosynthesis
LRPQIEALAAAGPDVTVVCSAGRELDRLPWSNRLHKTEVEISRAFSPWQDFRALIALIRTFGKGRFDIVHSTTPKAGLLAAIAGWFVGVPIRLHTFTGQTWVTLRGPMYHIARWADRMIGALSTRCYADSVSQRDFLIDHRIVSRKKIDVLGHGSLAGIDVQRFDSNRFAAEDRLATRASLGISWHAPVVLFVGRICEDKGVTELLAAHQRLRADGLPVELVLVGPFDDRQATLTPEVVLGRVGVHHVDFTDRPETYISVADVLALPSYREGFGTVVIEAAAMGVPAVGTDIYGLRDAIEPGETGVLVPVRDAQALASALDQLLRNRGELAQMAEAARRRATRLFDSRVVSDAVIAEYERLLLAAGKDR